MLDPSMQTRCVSVLHSFRTPFLAAFTHEMRQAVLAHPHVIFEGNIRVGVHKGAPISVHQRCNVQASGVASIALAACIQDLRAMSACMSLHDYHAGLAC